MTRYFIGVVPFVLACADKNVGIINSSPEAQFSAPTSEATYLEGYPSRFHAIFLDTNDQAENLNVNWYLNGAPVCSEAVVTLDKESECILVLESGEQEIAVQVSDRAGASHTDRITVDVLPTEAPTLTIETPLSSGRYYSDQLITFSGYAFDAEDSSDVLNVVWSSSSQSDFTLESTPDTSGYFNDGAFLNEGNHHLKATVVDISGKTHTSSVSIQVGPPNALPTCSITSPTSGFVGAYTELISLEGVASDVDIPSDWLEVTWHSDKDGLLGSSTPSSSSDVLFSLSNLSVNTHTISMVVKDENGATCTEFISLTVTTPPQVTITSPTVGSVINEDTLVTFEGVIVDSEDSAELLEVSWNLNGQQGLHTLPPTSAGLSQFSVSDLPLGENTIQLQAQDSTGYTSEDSVTFYINDLPSEATINLSPALPATTDDLIAQASGSTDIEGDIITYSYEWLKNGTTTGITTSTISSSLTQKGELWTVITTPTDGYGSGPSTQHNITIANTAPSITTVTISPATAVYSNSALSCTATAQDPDETPTLSYAWYNGTTLLSSGSTLTLDSTQAQPNDIIRCVVTATDSDQAAVQEETTITLSNLAPVVQSVDVTSTGGVEIQETLSCAVQAQDPDGGALTVQYEWQHNQVNTYGADLLLSANDYAVGDTLTCVATVTDEHGDSTQSDHTVTIQNSAPQVDSVVINPNTSITEGTLLNCSAQASDINQESFTIDYIWSHNGQTVSTGQQYTAQNVIKGDELTCSAVATDIHGASSQSDLSLIISNHTPSLSGVSLSPTSARTTDTITCAPVGSSDHDGDTVQSIYAWSVDGNLQSHTTSEISGPFSIGSTITCEITPFDGTGYGLPEQSSVQVINTAPVISSVSLTPSSAYTNDTLQAHVSASDIDNQTLSYTYEWYVNSQLVQSGTDATLSGTQYFTRGDVVYVKATANDSILDSLPQNSSSITIQNTAPQAQAITINPSSSIRNGDVVSCTASGFDADGDSLSISYEWQHNGIPFATGNSTTLHSAVRDDSIVCVATLQDSSGAQSTTSASITVSNTAPVAQSISLSPTQPKAADSITCNATGTDVDNDSVDFNYTWLVDGVKQSTVTATLEGPHRYNSQVTCQAVSNDGLEEGSYIESSVTINNTAPVMQSISFSNDPVYTNDSLTAIPTGYDIDNHSISYSYDWFVNNQLVQSGPQTALDGNVFFERNDTIYVQITPTDGITAGSPSTSSIITVQNTAPQPPVVMITPEVPLPNHDNVQCSVIEAIDPDGDALSYSITWYREGALYSGPFLTSSFTNDTIPTSEVGGYEDWACVVSLIDSYGAESEATEATAQTGCVYGSGYEEVCPAYSCLDIMADGLSLGDGIYYLDPTDSGDAFPAHCDMTTDGGGWTMCYTTDETIHLETENFAAGSYGQDGYRTDCSNIVFSDVIYEKNDTTEKAWFTGNSGDSFTLNELGYSTNLVDEGTLFTGHGVAPTDYDYQLTVCDGGWMWTGLMMSGYDGCSKSCNNWCYDTDSHYFRTDGDNSNHYNGIAFNENGHRDVPTYTLSVGIR